jgi:hypothetical protein
VALAGCGSTTAPSKLALAQVTDAADVTTRGPGYRFTIKIAAELEGQSSTLSGEGSVDEHGNQIVMNEHGGGISVSAIVKDGYIYVHLPDGAAQSHNHGKPWTKLNDNVYAQAYGAGAISGAEQESPQEFLAYLKASGEVTLLGHQTISGVQTTRYRAIVNLARYLASSTNESPAGAQRLTDLIKRSYGSTSLPMEVWVDPTGHIRRMALDLHYCFAGHSGSSAITENLFDYGPQPAVAALPPSEVTDLTSKVESEITRQVDEDTEGSGC